MIRVQEQQAPQNSIRVKFSLCCPIAQGDQNMIQNVYASKAVQINAFIATMNKCDIFMLFGLLLYIPASLFIILLIVTMTWIFAWFGLFNRWGGFTGIVCQIMEWPARVAFHGRERALIKHKRDLLPFFVVKSYFEGPKTNSIHSDLKRICCQDNTEGRFEKRRTVG